MTTITEEEHSEGARLASEGMCDDGLDNGFPFLPPLLYGRGRVESHSLCRKAVFHVAVSRLYC